MTEEEEDLRPEDIHVPTGPFVSYGRIAGAIVAPGQGTGASDIIGARILFAHLAVALAMYAAFPTSWWAPLAFILVGVISSVRYAHNCRARHHRFIIELREEFPEADFYEV